MLLYRPDFAAKCYIDNYLDVKITQSFDEFCAYEGSKCYLVTIYDIWKIVHATNIKEVSWENTFSATFIKQIQTYKQPIIFDASKEWVVENTYNTFIDFCKYVDVDSNNVFIILSNPQSVEINLEVYPYLKSYNFLALETYAYDAAQFGSTVGDFIYKLYFPERRKFLFINRRYSPERAYFYFKFHQHALLDSMHCTFKLDYIYGDNKNLTFQHSIYHMYTKYTDDELLKYIKSNKNVLNDSLPCSIKGNLLPIYNIDDNKSFLYSFWNLAAHNSTDINLISETYKFHHTMPDESLYFKTLYFLTEKTYRTILMKQPFIVFSNPYALKYLKKAGYKTFSPLFDESYDSVENFQERQSMIVKEVVRLNQMSKLEFDNLLKECEEITQHNYEVLMERCCNKYHNTIWTNNDLKPLLKNIDPSLGSTLLKWHNKY